MADPLIMLAAPRSYTSLVSAMLGQHPEMYGVPELNLFTIDILKDFWQLNMGGGTFQRHGMLRTVAQLFSGEQTAATINMAKHWVAARENRTGAEIFQELIDHVDPLIIVEKSPATVFPKFLEKLYSSFPNANFIHLIRHPIAQCKSTINLNDGIYALAVNSIDYTDDEAFLEPQLAWHDINVSIMNFLEKVDDNKKLLLRGEDVMSDPRGHFRKVCQWLNIRDDDLAIEEMLHPEASPYGHIGPINALFGNDPNFLRRGAFKQHTPRPPTLNSQLPWRKDERYLLKPVMELAQEFGYE